MATKQKYRTNLRLHGPSSTTITRTVIKAVKRIFNSDKICRSYCDFYFGVSFLEHSVDRGKFSTKWLIPLRDVQFPFYR